MPHDFQFLCIKQGDFVEPTNFENLEIYQLSKKLADEIWNIVLSWNNLAVETIGKVRNLLANKFFIRNHQRINSKVKFLYRKSL